MLDEATSNYAILTCIVLVTMVICSNSNKRKHIASVVASF